MSLRFVGTALIVIGSVPLIGGFVWHKSMKDAADEARSAAMKRIYARGGPPRDWSVTIDHPTFDTLRAYGPLANAMFYLGIGTVALGGSVWMYGRLTRKSNTTTTDQDDS